MNNNSLMYFVAGAGIASFLWLITYVFIFERTLDQRNKKIMLLKRKVNVLQGLARREELK